MATTSMMNGDDNKHEEIETIHSISVSLEETGKSCRICYETDNPETMIAPCLCRDDLEFVHRQCLDEYRAISVSNPAFSTCNTCNFDYIMEIENDHPCFGSPKAVFRFRVAWDIFKIAFCWFGLVSLAAFILYVTDTKDNIMSAYLWGNATVFGLMGIVGIIHGCMILIQGKNRRSTGPYYHNDCCAGCIWFGPVHIGHGSDCKCGEGKAGAVCLAILTVIAIVLIIIGVIYALVVSSILISQMAASHYSKVNAKIMTKEYVVKNLERYSKNKKLKMQQQQYADAKEIPIPSAPLEEQLIDSKKSKQQKNQDRHITIM